MQHRLTSEKQQAQSRNNIQQVKRDHMSRRFLSVPSVVLFHIALYYLTLSGARHQRSVDATACSHHAH
jgi:hypothetical protein